MRLFKLDNTRWFHVIIIMMTLFAVYISIKFLGRNGHAHEMVEIELNLPKDSTYLDLNQKNPYVDNT